VQGLLLDGRQRQEAVPVTQKDFVPCLDNYYLKHLLLAQRYFRGDREALVI
jgi:hypothetical protein